METNEQGLTKEEKIMFSILGIILIVAIGVLIINSFSANERKLEDSKTPIKETQGQKKENVEDETTTNNQEESLIEDEPVEDVVINTVVSNKPSTKPTQIVVKPNKPEIEENLGTGNTDIPGIIEWSFKDNIITEAYTNDCIIIDRNVILSTGEEVEAVVTVRKLEDNSWNIVDITSNEITVTEGLYKYYYTYGNQTKELLLTVKNKLEIEKIEFLTLDAVYEEDSTITEEEFTSYQNTLLNATLTNINNIYTITSVKEENSNTIIPIVLTITEELIEPTIMSKTLGVIPSIENNNWYQELTNKDIILWIDTNIIDITNPEINLNINNTDYYFDLNIVLEEKSSQPEENPDINEDTNEENKENPDINEDVNEENKEQPDNEEIIEDTEEKTPEEEKEEPIPEDDIEPSDDNNQTEEQQNEINNENNVENLNDILENSTLEEVESS